MKVFAAQIVDEPENAPTLLLATSEADLLTKLKACGDLQHLEGLQECSTADEISELYSEYNEERGEMYAGLFLEEQDL